MTPYQDGPRRDPVRMLVRHADAGIPGIGPRPWRGLTPIGHAQARGLVARLDGRPIRRILSDPSPRCRQTLVPLARAACLDVEPCRLLAAGVEPARLLRFLHDPETENAVLCTHREALLGVFAQLARSGSRFIDGLAPMGSAAVWVLSGGGDAPTRLRYLRDNPSPRPAGRSPDSGGIQAAAGDSGG
jgi:8-oxo-dGTP diphosphatase